MATFNFPYHSTSTEYPASGARIQLGNSYMFSAPSPAPDQRIFKLKFNVLQYFELSPGVLNRTAFPEINLALLEDFYKAHKLHGSFIYVHPTLGRRTCKFNTPLKIPHGVQGGYGTVLDLELEFIECPGIEQSGTPDMIEIEYVDFP